MKAGLVLSVHRFTIFFFSERLFISFFQNNVLFQLYLNTEMTSVDKSLWLNLWGKLTLQFM